MEAAVLWIGSPFQCPWSHLVALLAAAATAGVATILTALWAGHPPAPQPSFLEIQEDGLLHTHHVPTPTHASLFTGLRPVQHRFFTEEAKEPKLGEPELGGLPETAIACMK